MNRLYLIAILVACISYGDSQKWMKSKQFMVDSVLLNRWKGYPKLPNLVDLAQKLNLTRLVDALEKTGLDNTIDHEGPFTLFAPTNEAFNRIPDFAKKLPLKPLLSYHVARKNVSTESMTNDMLVRSLLSKRDVRINIYKKGKVVTANGCKVLKGPFRAFNGLLYIVDDVMWTVYERQGNVLTELERVPVGVFDHLIQAFTILGLDKVLSGKGPFTLLAPMDKAWVNLPLDVIEKILSNDTLFNEVMTHHVVPGTWYTEGLTGGDTLKTMNGDKINVAISGDNVKMDKASVLLADYTAGNGVIQVIDTVLLPKGLKLGVNNAFD